MKAVMMMFDSLNRAMLSPYGCRDIPTPNFARLAAHSIRFDQCYAGSLPCMPARRELHTGRYNFLHRSWGPMEPFDDSMPQILDANGIYTHLISDHTHYWEDGGATYHNRYSSWENVRGQEGDSWKVLPELMEPCTEDAIQNLDGQYFGASQKLQRHDHVNRKFMSKLEDTCLARTVELGLNFLRDNHNADNWMLQIECFDPHEPFFAPEKYRALFPDHYTGRPCDWPPYHHVTEDHATQEHLRDQYKALLVMCDEYLGKVLDLFDCYDLWKDTMLIVNTDHGYLLGEHGWWSKVVMPCYDEIVHTPLFIHDPRFEHDGENRTQIVQTIDLPATLLEFFGVPLPEDMQGRPIRKVIEQDQPIREYALFGIHGAHVCIFDGRYVYMKAPAGSENKPLYEYTLMPMHMRNMFSVGEMKDATATEPALFPFTKGCPVWKIPKGNGNGKVDFSELLMAGEKSEEAKHIDNNSIVNAANFGTKLYDMNQDPQQMYSLKDPDLHRQMAKLLAETMIENDSPSEQFERIGITPGVGLTDEQICTVQEEECAQAPVLKDYIWNKGAVNVYEALMRFIPSDHRENASSTLETALRKVFLEEKQKEIMPELVLRMIPEVIPAEHVEMVSYFAGLAGRTS